jgi:hypothetical protein
VGAIDDGACKLTFEHVGLGNELECKDMCSNGSRTYVAQ